MQVVITVLDAGQDMQRPLERLRANGLEAVWRPLDNTDDTARVIAAATGAEYVIACGESWNRTVIEGVGSQLRLISRFGAGYDKVDLDACAEHGVALCNTPGANAIAVAEHTLALMLSVCKRTAMHTAEIRKGVWNQCMSGQLYGMTVGIMGFGAIGQRLAQLLSGFNCTLLAYDPYPNTLRAEELGVTLVTREELLKQADFVSLHLPLLPQTAGLVNADFLAQMKPTAYLINTGRGKLVCEPDLAYALQEGRLAGAAMDVFPIQPLPQDSPLCQMEQVILTPHVASTCPMGLDAMMDAAVENVIAFASGRPQNLVTLPKGDRGK